MTDVSSCLTDSCNIATEQTTDGIRFQFVPTGDPGRQEMPAGIPEGLFRDRDGCVHALPTAFGDCFNTTGPGFSHGITDGTGSPSPVPGTAKLIARIINETPYRMKVLTIRHVGCAHVTTVPGAQFGYGLGPSVDGANDACVVEVPGQNSYSWPSTGAFLAEPDDFYARVTFAYLALFNRVPEGPNGSGWVTWLQGQVAANGTGDPVDGPDDLTLWTTICQSAQGSGDPGLVRPTRVAGVHDIHCEVLEPNESTPFYTAQPYFEAVRYGGAFPKTDVARIETTADYGICMIGIPLAPNNRFDYPT